jgi:hypothetical protein
MGQSREIFKLFFFHRISPPRPPITTLNKKDSGKFAEISEFQIANDTAESWLSSVIDTAPLNQWKLIFVSDLVPWLSGVIDYAESKLTGITDTAESAKTQLSQF